MRIATISVSPQTARVSIAFQTRSGAIRIETDMRCGAVLQRLPTPDLLWRSGL